MSEGGWRPIDTAPEGEVIRTWIEDFSGVRHYRSLMRRGRLWWEPDDSTRVYYAPTHWRPLPHSGDRNE